jgi:hypothetical protein
MLVCMCGDIFRPGMAWGARADNVVSREEDVNHLPRALAR